MNEIDNIMKPFKYYIKTIMEDELKIIFNNSFEKEQEFLNIMKNF
jgi:hypothetical protein